SASPARIASTMPWCHRSIALDRSALPLLEMAERLKRRRALRLQFWLLPDDDLGADRNALVKVGNVGVDQPETARRHSRTDGVGPVGAVNAIHGGAEIHCPRPERVAGSAGHEARQIGLALD